MSLSINTKVFDVVQGEILLPQRSTQRYISPSSAHAGIQVLPAIGPPFTLYLTRYQSAAAMQLEQDYGRSIIGALVSLKLNQIQYDLLPYRIRFIVLESQPVRAELLPLAAGNRNGVAFQFSPASVVTAAYTFQAVPM